MKRILISTRLSWGLFLGVQASSVMAASDHLDTSAGQAVQTSPAWVVTADKWLLAQANTAAELADGEIRKVDKENQRLTIKHGEIKTLDMPAMTMVFNVKDAAMLEPLKAGDKIRFKAIKDGSKYAITEIQPQP